MLVCGVYHPPKYNYKELDFMSYIIELADNALDSHPDTVIVCGGDVNKMDLTDSPLCFLFTVSFPTGLDRVLRKLTNLVSYQTVATKFPRGRNLDSPFCKALTSAFFGCKLDGRPCQFEPIVPAKVSLIAK